jgi:hypothetical protein
MEYSASYYKQFLLSIYKCKVDFEVILIHKKPKAIMGSYTPRLKRITIYSGCDDIDVCKDTAIHEYSHHLHHTEFDRDKLGQRPHGSEFWQIYGILMDRAAEKKSVLQWHIVASSAQIGSGSEKIFL